MARIVREVRPRYVVVENSPILTSRGLGVVLGDLAAMGFDARWGVVSASDTGAPHLRERIWIVAHAMRFGQFRSPSFEQRSHNGEWFAKACSCKRVEVADAAEPGCENVADTECVRLEQVEQSAVGRKTGETSTGEIKYSRSTRRRQGWPVEPELGRVVDGVAHRVDRLKAIGNGQVPRVAAAAWKLLR